MGLLASPSFQYLFPLHKWGSEILQETCSDGQCGEKERTLTCDLSKLCASHMTLANPLKSHLALVSLTENQGVKVLTPDYLLSKIKQKRAYLQNYSSSSV